ncbi:hypothetical protein PEPS_07930 [Persicobacter psychrovividus]|uniref:Uncharacterized protein n=1 Tax=Persicobacter psychrovividus TaxID=387638 RepID=A0ABN6LA49_9BACT|nr:hypothetical protein PEPS_07930 [Persicobacter psychrovividus]
MLVYDEGKLQDLFQPKKPKRPNTTIPQNKT